MSDQHSVLILGGGFAGWYAAKQLASALPAEVPITIIDRVDHMLYTPMLTEVAGGTVAASAVAVQQRLISARLTWINDEIESFDSHACSATLSSGKTIRAEHLVLALGSVTSYHGIPGAKQNSMTFKTLADANRARQRIDAMVTEAASLPPGPLRRKALTLVVAGGGYTGVETMAALYGRLKKLAATKQIQPHEIEAVLVEPMQRLMQEMPESLAAYAKRKLEANGIRVLTGVGVTKLELGKVTLANGEEIEPAMIVWDTGIEPSRLLKDADVPKGEHHGVSVDAQLRVRGFDHVWALGDCAEIPKDANGGTYAPTAQNAVREGGHLARNIALTIKGKEPRPFHYKMLGQLALISDRSAVANILGIELRGFIAWVMWWMIYIAKLPGMSNRLRVIKDLL